MAGKAGGREKSGGEDAPHLPAGIRIDKRGARFYDIVDPAKRDRLLFRVGHYHDPVIDNPEGMARFLDFLPVFAAEVEKGKWASMIFDSVSFAAISGRKWDQYGLNEGAKDPRQHYGKAVDLLEEILCVALPGLACNIGVVMHVSRTKVETEGTMVRAPLAPGRLLNMVSAAWPELYRVYVEKDKDGKKLRRFQTECDDRWQAGSTIDAPDETRIYRADPRRTWDGIWGGWPKTGDRPPWHGIVYGDPHVGKSTALTMLPTPCYVALFDAVGKDACYRRCGELKLAA